MKAPERCDGERVYWKASEPAHVLPGTPSSDLTKAGWILDSETPYDVKGLTRPLRFYVKPSQFVFTALGDPCPLMYFDPPKSRNTSAAKSKSGLFG